MPINKTNKGKRWKMSESQRRAISDRMSGDKHPFWGKHLSNKDKHEARISMLDKSNPAYVDGRVKSGFSKLLHQAKTRNKKVEISSQQFIEITSLPCHYCGGINETRGIDRVDNIEGYTLVNSVSCCKDCNYMKGSLTKNIFLKKCKEIVDNFKL